MTLTWPTSCFLSPNTQPNFVVRALFMCDILLMPKTSHTFWFANIISCPFSSFLLHNKSLRRVNFIAWFFGKIERWNCIYGSYCSYYFDKTSSWRMGENFFFQPLTFCYIFCLREALCIAICFELFVWDIMYVYGVRT